jgi:hypothetical protein
LSWRSGGSALLLGLGLGGCQSSPPEKSEAAAVSRAVNSLRDAENERKREHLEALRTTPCSVAEICAVRSQCLAAYELHVDVLARLASTSKTGPDNPESVERMKRDLARSHELGKTCIDAQGALIRRYKL